MSCETPIGTPTVFATKKPVKNFPLTDQNYYFFLYAPGRIRTCGARIRNPVLYPTELRGLTDVKKINLFSLVCQVIFLLSAILGWIMPVSKG